MTQAIEKLAREICSRRSAESGDPPCWLALPEAFAEGDCNASCQAEAAMVAFANMRLDEAAEVADSWGDPAIPHAILALKEPTNGQ